MIPIGNTLPESHGWSCGFYFLSGLTDLIFASQAIDLASEQKSLPSGVVRTRARTEL